MYHIFHYIISYLHYLGNTHLLSSSTIVTVDVLGFPLVTLAGKRRIILRLNVSLLSSILSSNIETSNEALVIPAGNITLYEPEE